MKPRVLKYEGTEVEVPTMGRTVWFSYSPGIELPAIVVAANVNGFADLVAFGGPGGDAKLYTSVSYFPGGGESNTWRWPVKV
jgi:hypothetical protein